MHVNLDILNKQINFFIRFYCILFSFQVSCAVRSRRAAVAMHTVSVLVCTDLVFGQSVNQCE